MKKIYISVPMNGRTNEDIEISISKMVSIAEAILGEEVEIVNPFNPKTSKEKPIEAIGKSIAKMQKADLLVGVYNTLDYRGCDVELYVANAYGIKTIRFDLEFICPDVIRMRREASGNASTPFGNTINA